MGRIVLLPDEVASQVAAGEVVERPASVVKELVENSLDAGATRIEVAIVRGGVSAIRVIDNGVGMDRDDALLSLERHATSKIRTGHDLARIQTLGFRGEALPSIASVSRFRMATRPSGAIEGTEITVQGGRIESVRASGEAPGTLVEARSIFFNLPARRKFLRSENTEASHVQHQLLLNAIGHPNVGFTFLRNHSPAFQVPPTHRLPDRIRDLRGQDLLNELLEVEPETENGIRISGLLGKPGVSRSTRSEQIIFVNGRPVENLTVHHGLREGYHTALMKGQYPVTFLFLDLDPEMVDVNVHPAKREVRFREPDAVREAIAQVVRKTLEADRSRWSRTFHTPTDPKPGGAPTVSARHLPDATPALIPNAEQFSLRRDWSEFPAHFPRGRFETGLDSDGKSSPEFAAGVEPLTLGQEDPSANLSAIAAAKSEAPAEVRPLQPHSAGTQFRILGILGKLYILMENSEGLVLVDQHAAHERILFEKMRRQMESEGVPSQRLLIPLTIQVAPRDYDWLRMNTDTLDRMGFALEPFGESTLKIDGIPQFFRVDDPASAVRHLVDELRSITSGTSRLRMGEDVIARTVCHHAIKANDDLRLPEIEQLVGDLLTCDLPYCCPHGRPTMIQISYSELEKKFGRKV
jgi:DNA mismatch repair protein MutL